MLWIIGTGLLAIALAELLSHHYLAACVYEELKRKGSL